MLTSNEIRQQFLDFFIEKHAHTFVPSSSVVPLDDPTLMFTNAGMNQFKDVFLGTGSRSYTRAVNTQKCIRAGGKHNDLDDVGKDTYHHTFFEMLGNWSFGDYFKKEAIEWAWDLLTNVWGLDKSRLHATVFEGDSSQGLKPDEEAAELWRTVTDIDHANIHLGNRKDNFWEMGDTGPCGPCSEIHIDLTPDKSGAKLVNAGTADVIEIWNLVFIQFNRDESGKLHPLPAKHVDTGMGFERITAVLQKKTSNYDTDIFAPIFEAIQKTTGAPPYSGKMEDRRDTAYRVIADHIRALTFSLTDGAVPSNEKRGYVVRSILRRAERFGWQYFDTKEPFLYKLVPTVVEMMESSFPELKRSPEKVQEVIRSEETTFLNTLERGIKLFQKVVEQTKEQGSNVISGKDAFDLHTTYGFFVDITDQMANEEGMHVDRQEFEKLMKEFQDLSGGQKKFAVSAVQGELPTTDDSLKYKGLSAKAKIIATVKDNQVDESGEFTVDEEVALVLDKTNFYAEQGGQIGDKGAITSKTGVFQVDDTQKLGDGILHVGKVVQGTIKVGQPVSLSVEPSRADTMRNHTCTHLLNWALRKVLGDHIEQKGSLVDPEKTRFDFSHDTPVTREEIQEIERLVNEKITGDLPVKPLVMPLEEAKQISGVRAVFGERYPDPVRVLLIGPKKPEDATEEDSVEFCGGTHLNQTGEAGFFKIISQEAVGKGVRRLTAVTGRGALETVQDMSSLVDELASKINCKPGELPSRIDSLQEEIKKLQQQIRKGASTDLQGAGDKLFESAAENNGARIIIGEMPSGPVEQMRNQADRLKQKAGSGVVILGWKEEDKVQLLASVTEDLVSKGVHAGKLIGQIAQAVGGRGGGKPNMAQAGGKEPEKLPDALELAKKLVAEQLG